MGTKPQSFRDNLRAAWLTPRNGAKLLGIAILVVLLARQDWGHLVGVLATARLELIAIAAVLMVSSVSLKAWRWRAILEGMSIHLHWREALEVTYSAFFIGLITPGRLGEVVKAFHLQRHHGTPVREGLLSIVADRLLDIYALLVAWVVAACCWPGEVPLALRVVGVAGLALGLGLVTVMVRAGAWLEGWLARLPDRGRLRRLRRLDVRGLAEVLRRGMGWRPVLFTAIPYVCLFGTGVVLGRAVGITEPVSYMVLVVASASLLALVPVTISGLGTREAVFVLLLGRHGIPSEAAMALSLLLFAVCYLLFMVLGGGVWLARPLHLVPGRDNRDKLDIGGPIH